MSLSFEILCVTMHQKDFSKIKSMNIRSNVVFANQTDETSLKKIEFENHIATIISTETRGVGKNRNIALLNASADICLFADDDVVYDDDLEKKVVGEFERHPDADVIIFNLETDDKNRKQKIYPKTKKCSRFCRKPWATFKIAFRLDSVKKSNIWFSTLYGGGAIFPSGEDSLWIMEAFHKGLIFYVSKEKIGKVSFAKSTWFTGYDEKYFYGKGAYYKKAHPKSYFLWMLYFSFRTRKMSKMGFGEKMNWMYKGLGGYNKLLSYEEYLRQKNNGVGNE